MYYCHKCEMEWRPMLDTNRCLVCGTVCKTVEQHRTSSYGVGDLVDDVASTVVTVAVIDTVGDVLSSIFD